MSKSDNTKRLKFRMKESDFSWKDEKTHNREMLVGIGQGDTKKLKRLAHKKNRKRQNPVTKMSGYGYGEENYRYKFSD